MKHALYRLSQWEPQWAARPGFEEQCPFDPLNNGMKWVLTGRETEAQEAWGAPCRSRCQLSVELACEPGAQAMGTCCPAAA